MKLMTDIDSIDQWIEQNEALITHTLSELVQIPSENLPPNGNELPMQIALNNIIQQIGFESELYDLASVHGLEGNAHYWPGRNYANRPNLFAVKRGTGNGKSLMFSVHADVVPGISGQYEPFVAVTKNKRLYGRGANDIKGGTVAILYAFRYLHEQGIKLKGDLLFESVVDEEMGGANGTLAGRLRGNHADAVIIPEPTNMQVCTEHFGGTTWRIVVTGQGGMGFGGEEVRNPIYVMSHIVTEIEAYHEDIRISKAQSTPSGVTKRPNVVISMINAGSFEPGMADGVPETCMIEVWVDCLAGETLEELEREFIGRIEKLCEQPHFQGCQVKWEQIIRFLPGSKAKSSLTSVLTNLVQEECGFSNEEHVAPFACDAFMFNLHSPSPAIVFGPSGENAHAADEFVDLDSLLKLTKIYIRGMMEWCEIDGAG